MKPEEFELTPELIKDTIREFKTEFPRYTPGRGEMKNMVFETYVHRLRLPWVTIEVGDIPDFSDPKVNALHRELSQFEDLF
jgi:hypothetical protein